MPKYRNISTWSKVSHKNTTGTRNKFITLDKDGLSYYFKTSIKKEKKDYPYEFWSEIIASQIGEMLNFKLVVYDVAYTDKEIGCLSRSIVNEENEELHDGFRYLIELFPELKDEKTLRKSHSYQKILQSLAEVSLGHFTEDVADMIIFDAIIGNSDRHSENWAILIKNKDWNKAFEYYQKSSPWKKLWTRMRFYVKTKGAFDIKKMYKIYRKNFCSFSPLYDSGSSLGRELSAERIENLLQDEREFDKFMQNGKPDIRWESEGGEMKHLSHFDLIKRLKTEHPDLIQKRIKKLKEKYNKNKLIGIIGTIDKGVPAKFATSKIPQSRKDFIIRYIDTRIQIILKI